MKPLRRPEEAMARGSDRVGGSLLGRGKRLVSVRYVATCHARAACASSLAEYPRAFGFETSAPLATSNLQSGARSRQPHAEPPLRPMVQHGKHAPDMLSPGKTNTTSVSPKQRHS